MVSHEHCNVLNDDFVNKTSVKIYLSQMKVTSCLANVALTELHVVPDEPTRLLLLTKLKTAMTQDKDKPSIQCRTDR